VTGYRSRGLGLISLWLAVAMVSPALASAVTVDLENGDFIRTTTGNYLRITANGAGSESYTYSASSEISTFTPSNPDRFMRLSDGTILTSPVRHGFGSVTSREALSKNEGGAQINYWAAGATVTLALPIDYSAAAIGTQVAVATRVGAQGVWAIDGRTWDSMKSGDNSNLSTGAFPLGIATVSSTPTQWGSASGVAPMAYSAAGYYGTDTASGLKYRDTSALRSGEHVVFGIMEKINGTTWAFDGYIIGAHADGKLGNFTNINVVQCNNLTVSNLGTERPTIGTGSLVSGRFALNTTTGALTTSWEAWRTANPNSRWGAITGSWGQSRGGYSLDPDTIALFRTEINRNDPYWLNGEVVQADGYEGIDTYDPDLDIMSDTPPSEETSGYAGAVIPTASVDASAVPLPDWVEAIPGLDDGLAWVKEQFQNLGDSVRGLWSPISLFADFLDG